MKDLVETFGIVSALLALAISTIFACWKEMKEFNVIKEKLNEKTNAVTVTKEHDCIRGDITETRSDIKNNIIETRNDIANSGTILKESVKEVHQDFKDYVNRIATANTAVLNVQQAVDTLTNLALQQGDTNQLIYNLKQTIQTLEKEKDQLLQETKNLEGINIRLQQELDQKKFDEKDYGIER